MFNQNQFVFIGNIASDGAEVRDAGEKKVANLRIAVNEYFKKDGERQERAEFLPIVIWSPKLIEFAGKYLEKGAYVRVEGKVSHRKVEKDGETTYRTDLIANKIDFLERKANGAGQGGEADD